MKQFLQSIFWAEDSISEPHTLFTKSSQHKKPKITTVLSKSTWLQPTPISLDCWAKCNELETSCSKHTQLEKCKLRKLSLPKRYSSYFLIPPHISSQSLRITLWNLHYSCALLAWFKLFINSMYFKLKFFYLLRQRSFSCELVTFWREMVQTTVDSFKDAAPFHLLLVSWKCWGKKRNVIFGRICIYRHSWNRSATSHKNVNKWQPSKAAMPIHSFHLSLGM